MTDLITSGARLRGRVAPGRRGRPPAGRGDRRRRPRSAWPRPSRPAVRPSVDGVISHRARCARPAAIVDAAVAAFHVKLSRRTVHDVAEITTERFLDERKTKLIASSCVFSEPRAAHFRQCILNSH